MKRIIPVLLIKDGGLVKSIKFKDHKYVGDPINAVKIFNEKKLMKSLSWISVPQKKTGLRILI